MISVDAMGGDFGPSIVVPGVVRARVALGPDANPHFLLHGDETAISAALRPFPEAMGFCEIRHTSTTVSMDAKPAHAMRRGKGTSMWNAVESVRNHEANAAVSAGNTGALMAISRLLLRMVGSLDRPALVANWPTLRGLTSVLDVGANIDCDAERLVEFAVMGAAYHRTIYQTPLPSVALLNIGTEHEKGHEEVRGADRLLRMHAFDFEYRGFVEGDDIARGAVDVIVTDGFTGNVALKTGEGLAHFFRSQLRVAFTADLLAKLGAFIAQQALRKMGERLDPSAINGGPFLGLNGIVVKSHGGADARGFATAICRAVNLAKGDFTAEIDRTISQSSRAVLQLTEERAMA